jgi:N-acetylmuramoyl-L-alanine amidase
MADVRKENKQDPTQGALFYHADYVSPYWKSSMTQIGAIGQHVFYHPLNP